jgi:hypothetical protein
VQMVQVFPGANAVIALNGAMEESAVLLPHIRRHFPAGFSGGGDAGADAALAERLKQWSAQPALTSTAAADPAALAGRWVLGPNDKDLTALDFAFVPGELRFTMRDKEGAHSVVAGFDDWVLAPAYLPGADLHHGYRMENLPIAAGARWIADDRLELVIHYLESAFRDTFVFSVTGNQLTMARRVNINSGARAWPVMTAARG